MIDTTSGFKLNVRKGNITQPTQRGFKLTEWQAAWVSLKSPSKEDETIYAAGTIFFSLFEELRNELGELYKQAPDTTNNTLIRSYCAISNRDRAVLGKKTSDVNGPQSIHAITASSGQDAGQVTLQEVADQCVDSVHKAIEFAVKRKSDPFKAEKPLTIFEFTQKEAALSNIYDLYEDYWQALLWGDYDFFVLDKKNKVFQIKQKNSEYEIYRTATHIRKSKLAAQLSTICASKAFLKYHQNDHYISSVKIKRDKKLRSKSIVTADEKIQAMNSDIQYKILALQDFFPQHFLEKRPKGFEFNILDLLQAFRLLVLLAAESVDRFPKDDSIYTHNKLLEFCPWIKKNELINAIARALDFDYKKSCQIVDFLTFNAAPKQELWCHPLLDIGSGKLAYLVSSALTPVITRVVEHWLVAFNIDLQEKGEQFENELLSSVSDAINGNGLVQDYEEPVGKRFKLSSGDEEEIDLLLKFGETILVGELKSIVTTDSAISSYRTYSTLEYATNQAVRKSDYIKDNIEEVFNILGWEYSGSFQYKLLPVVITSNPIFTGISINSVPVCDPKILTAYLEKNTASLLSTQNDGKFEDIAWYQLYCDFQEFQDNIAKYLNDPPQLYQVKYFLHHDTVGIPYIDDDSFKIMFTRLIPRDFDINEVFTIPASFKATKSSDFEEQVEKMDRTF